MSEQFSNNLPSDHEISDPVGVTASALRIGFDKEHHSNCSAILFNNLQRNPDNIAVMGPLGELNYRELCANAAKWGHAFIKQGLKRGDRIPFLLDDTPVYPAAFFGAVRAGFVPVLLNTQTTPDLLEFFLNDTSARIALCEARLAEQFNTDMLDATTLEMIVIANADTRSPNTQYVIASDFVSGYSDTLQCADTGPNDMAFWMYSSGSTGRPKGIVHLHHDMAYTNQSYAANILKLSPEDVCFSVPKLFFAYGFGNSITFPFSVGAASVLMPDRPEASHVLDTIERFKPTALFGLPTLYTALCHSDKVEARDFSSLRICLSAAEVLSEDIFNAWKKLTGLEAVEGLGSTELLHIYLSNTEANKQIGSAGKAVPGYEVVLKDNTGNLVATGNEGVMWVRGTSSAPHYWNRPDQTADTMRKDWIYTGDRFVEKEGYYFFQGRADDLIKVSGQWVWPLEVERCLSQHTDVYECAVLAHELDDKRMTLRAVVHLKGDIQPDVQTTTNLQDYVRKHLLPFKYPRIVNFVEELPKTGTGKLDRQAIAAIPLDKT